MIQIVNEIEQPNTPKSIKKVEERLKEIQDLIDKLNGTDIVANIVVSGKITGSGNETEYSVLIECDNKSDEDKIFAAIFRQ